MDWGDDLDLELALQDEAELTGQAIWEVLFGREAAAGQYSANSSGHGAGDAGAKRQAEQLDPEAGAALAGRIA